MRSEMVFTIQKISAKLANKLQLPPPHLLFFVNEASNLVILRFIPCAHASEQSYSRGGMDFMNRKKLFRNQG